MDCKWVDNEVEREEHHALLELSQRALQHVGVVIHQSGDQKDESHQNPDGAVKIKLLILEHTPLFEWPQSALNPLYYLISGKTKIWPVIGHLPEITVVCTLLVLWSLALVLVIVRNGRPS